jgi:hypothetical protein
MVRAAQSVVHQQIGDRLQADRVGYGIAEFVLNNWETVSRDFGRGAEDEMEVVERVAQQVLRRLPQY